MKVTKIIYSDLVKKWYLQIENLQEIVISEDDAKKLIAYYNLAETNFNRWSND